MINRYDGNTGRVIRYSEPEERRSAARTGSPSAPPPKQSGGIPGLSKLGALQGIESITKLLPEKLGELETEDFILLLILYLMYRESGDSELLIIMGAMFLL